jgi:geranylgeranyl pyrophosphate synthase
LEGKLTLPLILLVKENPAIRKDLEQIMTDGDYSSVRRETILEKLENTGILSDTRKRAYGFAAQARKNLELLEKTEYRKALEEIPAYMIERRK